MSCIKPITISTPEIKTLFRKGILKTSTIEVPCGRCINCRIVKQSQLSFLCKKEMLEQYKAGRGNSFVTLTYDDNHIPVSSSGHVTLRKTDLQKFMKRVRRNLEYHYGIKNNAFRYLACGEYGDSFGRSHYHICFFGLSTEILQKITKKVWKFGLCDIGVLTSGGVRYVCKYLTKNIPTNEVKKLREKYGVENPFVVHSFGLGKDWINKNIQKIADDNFMFNLNGKLCFYPKYILRYVSIKTGKDYRPIVEKYINKMDFIKFHSNNDCRFNSIYDMRLDDNFVRYQNNIAVMRAKNIPVDDESARIKKYMRPISKHDRCYIRDLAVKALLIDVPF